MKNSKGMIILLVALAALTVVVGVGVFFFYPKEAAKSAALPTPANAAPATPAAPLPSEFDPVEWTRNPQSTPIQTPATPAPNDQGFTVTLPPETKPVATALPPSPGATFPGDAAPAAPAPVAKPAKAVATKPVAKPVAVPHPTPVVQTPQVLQYWIQVASFKDRYQAENTAKALEQQGLKGTLSTATVNGVAVVRVRVGPYTNEAEAGKFLAWLKPLKAFEASYVTKVAPPKAP